jgi:hypothetical protein
VIVKYEAELERKTTMSHWGGLKKKPPVLRPAVQPTCAAVRSADSGPVERTEVAVLSAGGRVRRDGAAHSGGC